MKNRQRGSAVVILLVIIVIVLLGVISWMYFRQPTQTSQLSDNSQVTSTQSPVQVPASNNKNPVADTAPNPTQASGVMFMASATSGSAPLSVIFGGWVDTKVYGEGPYAINFGNGDIDSDYGTVSCKSSSTQCDITPVTKTFKTPGTYKVVFSTSQCIHLSCTPGPAISIATIIVK